MMARVRQFLWFFATTVFFTQLAGCSGSSSGVATGVTGGNSATITATSSGINGTANLTVSAPPAPNATLSTITIAPTAATIAQSATQPYTATGHYSDNSTLDLTSTATWSSSSTTAATINSSGVATGVTGNSAVTMTATSGAVSGTANLTVIPKLVSIAVSSPLSSIAQYTTQQFTATGTYSDNTTRDLTATVTWSANNSVVTINSAGLATAAATTGAFTITATSGAITGTRGMGVSAIMAQGAAGFPTVITMPYNQGQVFTTNSISFYRYQAIVPISKITLTNPSSATTQFTVQIYNDIGFSSLNGGWTCSATGVAPITCTGSVIGTSSSTFIKITHQAAGDPAPTSFTLDIPPATISITPLTPSIPNNTTLQFIATGNYNGTQFNLAATNAWSSVNTVWSSNNTALAEISGRNGLASSIAVGGPVTITASYAGVSGTTNLTVNNATLSTIAVTASAATIANTTTQQYTATGTYSDASTKDLTSLVTWTTNNPAIATINSMGLATGVTVGGPVTMTATLGGVSGTTTLQVN